MSQQHTSLYSPDLYALGVPPCEMPGSFSYGGMTTVNGLVGVSGLGLVGCQALPCAENAGLWGRMGHKVAGCRDPVVPEGSSDLLIGRPGF